jgi:uncharacterized protein (TIGR00255 family)
MSVRSMTGFARVRKANQIGEVLVTLKTVNHRALDLHFYLPSLLAAYEPDLRNLVKQRLTRGHVDARLAFHPQEGGVYQSVNTGLLEAYLVAFRRAAAQHGVDQQPDLNSALRLPGMFDFNEESEPPAELGELVLAAFDEALVQLNDFRAREGSEIAAVLAERKVAILALSDEMMVIRAQALHAFHARLSQRLAELLAGANLDPQRLAQEAAVLADRSDIGEEIERLRIHAAQLGSLLSNGGEIGKKLDFLLQEMNRESNTILSKTNGVGEQGLRITEIGLELKAQLEKIREQALNLE